MFIWLYLMDIIVGNARFGLLPLAGILAVMVGVTLVNISPSQPLAYVLNPLNIQRQPGAWGMLIYAFGLALGRIIDNRAADSAPPALYAFFSNAPCVLAGLAVLLARGRAWHIAQLARERMAIAIIGAFAGMYAYVLMLVALDYYQPSVVEPVSQVSVLIAIALGGLWFKERIAARWPAGILVVLGAALLLAS